MLNDESIVKKAELTSCKCERKSGCLQHTFVPCSGALEGSKLAKRSGVSMAVAYLLMEERRSRLS